MSTAAVVLAAGGSTRFTDGSKLIAEFRGKPLVRWAVEAALDAALDDTFVVTGAVDLTAALGALPVTYLWNPDWERGVATSLAVAVAAAKEAQHKAVVVGLGDQPFVSSAAWRAVARSSAPIAVATYRGQRRNPVRLAEAVWPLLPVDGDAGARVVIDERHDLVAEVPCPGDPVDVDTVEDLAQWS